MFGNDILYRYAAAGSCHGSHVGAGFDLIGNDGISAAHQALYAADLDHIGTGAHNIGAHGIEEVGQIYDMRLLGGVFNNGLTLSQGCSDHNIHGGSHRDHIQIDVGALQAFICVGIDDRIAAAFHLGAQRLKALDMLVNGTDTAKVAAAGHSDLGLAEATQIRTQQIIGCAHLTVALTGGRAVMHTAAIQLYGIFSHHTNTYAQFPQDLQLDHNITNHGDVFNAHHTVHQNGGGDDCNGGVFRATDIYFTKQRFSAVNHIFFHEQSLDSAYL